MVNQEKLKLVLEEYKKNFVDDQWEKEKFKWIAIKHFKDNWDINATDFEDMFTKATDKTYQLLGSMNNFPKAMIKAFAQADQEATRAMFIHLFDESKDLADRIEKFQSDSDMIKESHNPGGWNQHYQNANSISTYLWLRFPDKYYIYKYSEVLSVAKELDSNFKPKKGASINNVVETFKLYDEIAKYISSDQEIVNMLKSVMIEEAYPDPALRTLTFDVCFYISRYYSKKDKQNSNEWQPLNYDPKISSETWLSLLKNPEVFHPNHLEIMKRFVDYGGMATCTQLAVKYGETKNFYNSGSVSLAKKIHEKTDCPLYAENGETRWWPVLYTGKLADKEEDGSFVWKLRDELKEALTKINMIDVKLFAQSSFETNQVNYWWLNSNPKIWSISSLPVGSSHFYSIYNENNNKRRVFQNFVDAKKDDIIIGYESNPVKQVVSILRVTNDYDGKEFHFEKLENLASPIEYNTLKSMPELQDMEYFANPNGSLFKLTKGEFDFIIDLIRDENPKEVEVNETYSVEDFLNEVYMSRGKYEALTQLLENKKNLILQGAPGVGKTFAAKRLAYSIIGKKDDQYVEFIQFHQNYSYEDFVMGYKPQGDSFTLTNGIFYKFCAKAQNNPNKPYFFIIDEINRGNMSKIFGELLMLIEKDYRGAKVTLAYNNIPFFVPDNLYIIGMMNTADRSLAMIDYALRRRFSFFDMEPGFHSVGFIEYQKSLDNDTFDALIDIIIQLNKEISIDYSLGKGFTIGHSYFCGQKECSDDWMKLVVEHDVLPMLREYWFDEPSKIQKWENLLRGVFND